MWLYVVGIIVILLAIAFVISIITDEWSILGFTIGGIGAVLFLAACALVSFLVMALLVWAFCKLAPMAGFAVIHGWTVKFSWALAGLVWVIYLIVHGIFSFTVKANRD